MLRYLLENILFFTVWHLKTPPYSQVSLTNGRSIWHIYCGSFSNYLLLIHPNCVTARTMEKGGTQNSESNWHLIQISSLPQLYLKDPWNRQKSWSMDALQAVTRKEPACWGGKAALLFPRSLEWPLRSGAWQQQRSFTATNFPHEVGLRSQKRNWGRVGEGTELLICFSFVFLPFAKFSSTPMAG